MSFLEADMEDAVYVEPVELGLSALIESVLFVASGPVSSGRLAKILDTTPAVVEDCLRTLDGQYQTRGLRLQRSGSSVQLMSAPESRLVVERFLGLEVTSHLSQASLEVLAIIAFMQPVTRPRIDEIRGVNSDSSLRTLLSLGLIEEVGRMETPGRPILYGSTPEFLQYFGLQSLADIPQVDTSEEEE